jgi:hypothetical protein
MIPEMSARTRAAAVDRRKAAMAQAFTDRKDQLRFAGRPKDVLVAEEDPFR